MRSRSPKAQKGSQKASRRREKGLLVDKDITVRSKKKPKATKAKFKAEPASGKRVRTLTVRNDPAAQRRPILDVGSEQEVGQKLLDVLKSEGSSPEIVYTEGNFWEYNGKGRWVPITSDEIHHIVGSFDGTFYKENGRPKKLRISNAFALGVIKRAENFAVAPDFFAQSIDAIVFSDVTVTLSEQGEIKVVKHSANHRCRVGYDFSYDPKASVEKFMQMQRDHFRDDEDWEAKILVEQEFYGACLFGFATRFQKCLALPCDGGGGRSTKLKIIEAAFPPGLVSHLDARELKCSRTPHATCR